MCSCCRDGKADRRSKNFWVVPFAGFLALAWFLIRVIPKPSRAAYPCQRAAFPIASAFICYAVTLAAAAFAFGKAKLYTKNRRYIVASVCALVGLVALLANISSQPEPVSATPFTPADSANRPIGTALGVNPGRVVMVHEPNATSWNGTSGNWWSDANTNQELVDSMVSKNVRWLTGSPSDQIAWERLFKYFNQRHGKGGVNYSTGEKIAIKINQNAMQSNSAWDNKPYTSPQVMLALVRQLVTKAGVDDASITITDPSRFIGAPIVDKIHALYPDVVFVDRSGLAGRVRSVPDTGAGKKGIHFASDSCVYQDKAFIATCLTQANYLINCGLFRGHNLAGITVCAKSHFGSFWTGFNANDGWSPWGADSMVGLHGFVSVDTRSMWGYNWKRRPMGSYNVLVDLMGHKDLGAKTMLFMVDGLYPSLHQSSAIVRKFSSAPFGTAQNPDWTSCVFASQDQVALESVVLDFLRSEKAYEDSIVTGTVDNYLHEAAQAANPPSGVAYDPEDDGSRLANLGTHEHWNNATSRHYSRNLGTGNGIELTTSQPAISAVLPQKASANKTTGMSISASKRTIGLTLAQQGSFVLTLRDASGRSVWRHEAVGQRGHNSIALPAFDSIRCIPVPGTYLASVRQGTSRCEASITVGR